MGTNQPPSTQSNSRWRYVADSDPGPDYPDMMSDNLREEIGSHDIVAYAGTIQDAAQSTYFKAILRLDNGDGGGAEYVSRPNLADLSLIPSDQ